MKNLCFIYSLILLFLCVTAIPAQTTTESPTAAQDEKEKARLELEKKAFALAERVAADAATLKLPENRAFLIASAADLLWEQDAKRARSLFQSAATELVAANVEADKDDPNDPYAQESFYNSPRRTILQMAARHDPELALEMLIQTRSPKLAAEMQKTAAPAAAGQTAEKEAPKLFGNGLSNLQMQAQQELQLEQSLATQAAANDPKRAVKLFRESMAKGVTYEVLNLVDKLHQKDAELANTLLAEVTGKLLESDFSKQTSRQERLLSGQLLRQFGQQSAAVKEADSKKQPLKLDDKIQRDLANKIADNLVRPTDSATSLSSYYELSSILPVLEKVIPERAAQLKQKQAEIKKSFSTEIKKSFSAEITLYSGYESLNDPNTPPEKLIADAAQIPVPIRSEAYRRAIDKMAAKGEIEPAKQLLKDAPVGKERDEALSYLDSKFVEKAVKDGKFDEARKIIATIGTKNAQIEQLVKLAVVFYDKGDKESRATALKIMDEARGMVDSTPQNEEEMQNLAQVIGGYAVIDSNQAFGLLAPFVDQTNELIQAAALIAKYQKQQFIFRDGEIMMTAGLEQVGGSLHFIKQIGLLAAADFERTRDLADKFQRSDIRILLNLIIAQSILQKKTNGNSVGFTGGSGISITN